MLELTGWVQKIPGQGPDAWDFSDQSLIRCLMEIGGWYRGYMTIMIVRRFETIYQNLFLKFFI